MQSTIFVGLNLNMFKNIVFIVLCFVSLSVGAQNTSDAAYSKPSKDYFMFQMGYDGWAGAPDSVNIGGISRSMNAYLCYDFPIKTSNFSFAAGVGVASSNIFLKDQKAIIGDSLTEIQFLDDNDEFKRFKYSLTYLEAPLELRYFSNKKNRNKGFKAAIGMKVGALINAHTKSVREFNNKPIREKVSTRRFIETYRVGGTLRFGYGNFSVYGQYGLNTLFRVGNGPQEVIPFSVGICISGL
jgi:hypothetical protein